MKYFISLPILFSLLLISTSIAYAENASLGCALNAEQFNLGALPELSRDDRSLYGYSCELIPRYSTFKGNWLPTLPRILISQTSKSSSNNDSTSDAGNFQQVWKAELAIKRLGHSHLVIRGGQKKSEHTLKAQEEIPYFSNSASSPQEAILIQQDQKAIFEYSENSAGIAFVFPYRPHQPLTELFLQHIVIQQPVQANLLNLPKRSLYKAEIRLTELGVRSWSNNNGFNINWDVALASGDISLESKVANQITDKEDDALSIRASLELHYQHKINRTWFAFTNWRGGIHSWKQAKDKSETFQISQANNTEYTIRLGTGFKF